MSRRLGRFAVVLVPAAALLGTAAMFAADDQAHKHGEHRHHGHEHAQRPSQREAALPRPVVSTHELMELFNEPLYHELQELVQTEPADRKGWGQIRDEGLRAAEIVNLVAVREMAEAQERRWRQLTREAQAAALELAGAAKRQDWQATTSAYRSLIKNCNDCHQSLAPDHAPELKP